MTRIGMYITVALVGGLLAAGSLSAQARSDGKGMMARMDNCPMMTAMRQGPDAALAKRKALDLTSDQVAKLETLRANAREGMKQSMDSMSVLHERLATLTATEQLDEAAARAVFDHMGTLHTGMGLAMLRAKYEVRALLTPAQRLKLADGGGGTMKGMHMPGMMGSEMSGKGMGETMSMAHCSMMGGMMGDTPSGMQQSGKSTPKKPVSTAAPKKPPMDHHRMPKPE